MQPKVSIIIPVYNTERDIERCIDSVRSQTFKDFECLLIDDGSTDCSGKICDEYASNDDRIIVYHKTNGGVSSARNLGLDNAHGEWICFVDSDDELLTSAIESFVNTIDDTTDFIVGDYIIVPNENLPNIDTQSMQYAIDSLEFLFTSPFHRYGGYLWNKLFRKSVIDKHSIRFNEEIIYNEDRLFIFNYIIQSPGNGRFINEPVYRYYRNVGGAMASIEGSNYWKFESDLDAFIKICKIARKYKYKSKSLIKLIYRCTYYSYRWNCRLNKQYGGNDSDTNDRLKHKLNSVVSYKFILRFIIEEKFSHIKGIIKKLIYYFTNNNLMHGYSKFII